MTKPSIISQFIFAGEKINIEWYDLVGKDLPNLDWHQVYMIGDANGLVPIVIHGEGNPQYNLPGGRREPGEDIIDTLYREAIEELNYKVLDWALIGYQKLIEPNGDIKYQLRVKAKLEKIGDFSNDPGGDVTGHKLVKIDEVNQLINYGEVGEAMIDAAKSLAL